MTYTRAKARADAKHHLKAWPGSHIARVIRGWRCRRAHRLLAREEARTIREWSEFAQEFGEREAA